jgi:hypothetical protein
MASALPTDSMPATSWTGACAWVKAARSRGASRNLNKPRKAVMNSPIANPGRRTMLRR